MIGLSVVIPAIAVRRASGTGARLAELDIADGLELVLVKRRQPDNSGKYQRGG